MKLQKKMEQLLLDNQFNPLTRKGCFKVQAHSVNPLMTFGLMVKHYKQ